MSQNYARKRPHLFSSFYLSLSFSITSSLPWPYIFSDPWLIFVWGPGKYSQSRSWPLRSGKGFVPSSSLPSVILLYQQLWRKKPHDKVMELGLFPYPSWSLYIHILLLNLPSTISPCSHINPHIHSRPKVPQPPTSFCGPDPFDVCVWLLLRDVLHRLDTLS